MEIKVGDRVLAYSHGSYFVQSVQLPYQIECIVVSIQKILESSIELYECKYKGKNLFFNRKYLKNKINI